MYERKGCGYMTRRGVVSPVSLYSVVLNVMGSQSSSILCMAFSRENSLLAEPLIPTVCVCVGGCGVGGVWCVWVVCGVVVSMCTVYIYRVV